jgi:hypothetical protein
MVPSAKRVARALQFPLRWQRQMFLPSCNTMVHCYISFIPGVAMTAPTHLQFKRCGVVVRSGRHGHESSFINVSSR